MQSFDITDTTIPHADFGDPDCCGCLIVVSHVDRPETVNIVCNECNAVIRSVVPAELAQTLTAMELQLDVAAAICPHCGKVNLFPGLSAVHAFVCHHCGKGVPLSE